jgi:glycosyltransferase involved in cell wall biosynthesis
MASLSPFEIEEKLGTIRKPLMVKGKPGTLSVCMIVKNEEQNIARAIKSFLAFADEIVVNDTGSTDRTCEIVQSLPKTKLIHSTWIGDFSYSRNLSLGAASCSWILWLDADDVVPENMVGDFNKLKKAPLDRAFGFQVVNTQNGQPMGMRFIQTRMFPNHPQIRFERKIHEQIIYSLAKLGLHMFYLETEIWHMGYEDDTLRVEKSRRNLALLLQEEDAKIDPTVMNQIGDAYAIIEDYPKAIEWYQKAFETPNAIKANRDLYKNAPVNIGRCYQRQKDFTKAIEWYNIALDLNSNNPDSLFYKAETLLQSGDKQAAVPLFKQLLTSKIAHSSVGTQHDVIKLYSFKYYGEYLLEQKQFEPLIPLCEEYRKKYPTIVDSLFFQGLALLGMQQPAQAVTYLEAGIKAMPAYKQEYWFALLHAYELLGQSHKREETQRRMQLVYPNLAANANQQPNDSIMLSVCMIVKNEEGALPACLESIKGIWDELIIVDTGSTDKTTQIATQYGAQVHHFAWCDDFAAARNESIAHAKGSWVLWLDADDVILPEDAVRLRALCVKLAQKAHSLLIKSSADGGNTGSVFNQIRLFPNHKGVHFEGRIHEQILPSLNAANIVVEFHTIKIIHTGYADPELVKKKHERNLKLMLEDVNTNPATTTAVRLWSIAGSYHDLGNWETAIEWYQKSLEMAERKGNDPHVKTLAPVKIAACLAELGHYEQGLQGVEKVLQKDSHNAEAILLRAQILNSLQKREQARAAFEQLFWFEEQRTLMPLDFQGIKIKAIEFLGQYWDNCGKRDVAVALLKQGVGLAKGEPLSAWTIIHIYFEYEEYAACENMLQFGLTFEANPDILLELGKVLILQNKIEEALLLLQQGCASYPAHTGLQQLSQMLVQDIDGNE